MVCKRMDRIPLSWFGIDWQGRTRAIPPKCSCSRSLMISFPTEMWAPPRPDCWFCWGGLSSNPKLRPVPVMPTCPAIMKTLQTRARSSSLRPTYVRTSDFAEFIFIEWISDYDSRTICKCCCPDVLLCGAARDHVWDVGDESPDDHIENRDGLEA